MGEKGRRGSRGWGEGSVGLYLSTCSCSGEFRDSSKRRRQRRLARSSCCSWASWGASCLSQTHKHTCTKHLYCCPCARSEPPGKQQLYFREDGKEGLLLPCIPLEMSEGPGLLRCWKEEPAVHHLAACLGSSPGPGTHPALERAGFPRGHFHSDSNQPFPALCLCRGGEGPHICLFLQPPSL